MASQVESVDDVLHALKSGTEDPDLLGVYESPWLDFKGTYHLDDPREQWELSKDVAALAPTGGAVVVGIQTLKDDTRDEEYASKIAPVPPGAFDTKRALDIINRDMYPPLEGVRIEVYPRGANRLVAIIIPPQDPDRGPILLTRVIEEDGRRWNAFAIPRRSGSHTSFEPIGLVHRDIADGRRARRSGTGQDGTTDLTQQIESAHSAEAWTTAAAEELDRLLGWTDIGVLYLAAVPEGAARSRPKDFFAQDGFRAAMSPRHQLRHAGFGLTYGHNISVGPRELLAIDDDRSVLRVETDGRLIAGAAGTPDFLGWAQDRHRQSPQGREPLRINPVALGEYVYEFSRFVKRELASRWGPQSWTLVAHIRRAQTAARPLALVTGYKRNASQFFDAVAAEVDERIESAPAQLDPVLDAAHLLEAVYGVFALQVSRSPFVKNGRFDEKELLSL